MKFYADYHTHSLYSFDVVDKTATVEGQCLAAAKAGLSEIALTEHYEVDGIADGFYDMPDLKSYAAELKQVKEKLDGIIKVVYGLEIGQLLSDGETLQKALDGFDYDVILGSIHGIHTLRDFCYTDFTLMEDRHIEFFWKRYLTEMKEQAEQGGFDIMTHLTYPLRYLKKYGRTEAAGVEKNMDMLEEVLKKIIEKNIALECNTSGYRQGLGVSMPDKGVFELYRSLGGFMVTAGSDSHFTKDTGASIKTAYEMFESVGFKYVTVFRNRKPCFVKI